MSSVFYIETRGETRFADLDTQRHVTSVTYEDLALGSRHALLEREGYDLNRLLETKTRLHMRAYRSRFTRQQFAGASLGIQTRTIQRSPEELLWQHLILGPDGKEACRLQVSMEAAPALSLKARSDARPSSGESAAELRAIPTEDFFGAEPVPETKHPDCRQVESEFQLRNCERDPFGLYRPRAYWRILEEGRWHLANELGLDLQAAIRHDTTMFWMGGAFRAHGQAPDGARVRIRTWFERMEKIRAYTRQEAELEDGTPLLSSREELLIVSLSKSRPVRAPEALLDATRPYREH